MPDSLSSYQELPILRELREDLTGAFRAAEAAPRRTRGRRRTHRFVDFAGLALGFATAAAVVFVFAINGGHRPPPSPSPGRLLGEAAVAAASDPIAFPRDDQFFYVHSIATALLPIQRAQLPLRIGGTLNSPRALVTADARSWSSATRDGLIEQRLISVSFPTAAGRRRWERLGRPPLLRPDQRRMATAAVGGGKYLLGNIALTRHQLLSFPTQPRILYARLYAAGGSPREVFVEISDTLRWPVPGPLRSALYRTLALVPGMRYLGTVVDRFGRTGTAVGMVDRGMEQELIIDPRTGVLLDERVVVVDAKAAGLGLRTGTITSDTAYLQRAVTASLNNPFAH